MAKPKTTKSKRERLRFSPIRTAPPAFVNAPDETLRYIAERIDKGVVEREPDMDRKLLSAAYKEIMRQRRLIKKLDRLLTLAVQRDIFEDGDQ